MAKHDLHLTTEDGHLEMECMTCVKTVKNYGYGAPSVDLIKSDAKEHNSEFGGDDDDGG